MNKRGGAALVISVLLIIILIVAAFLYLALFKPDYSLRYENNALANPAEGLTDAEAAAKFDESFVYYVLVSIKAYQLHNPPLSSDTPKILFKVDSEIYNAIINKGYIIISRGDISNKDVVITTTKEEAIKMIRDRNYVEESFISGKSTIDLLASKSTLFQKGYLNLYTELTGKSITGNVIKIYLD